MNNQNEIGFDPAMTASAITTSFNTPVLFLIFNRPQTTKLVFEEIRKARPVKLYVAADGPRQGFPDDVARCTQARQIATAVDWPCDVVTLFRSKNLGCGEGIATGITWFFEHETEGIILEDDCLPSTTFFRFCAEMLQHYRHDTRVMQIGGNNFESIDARDPDYSYSFSNYFHVWGWATWKRAWVLHDFKMTLYPEISQKKYLQRYYDTRVELDFFNYIFEKMFEGDDRTNRRTVWDYQWQFACTINSGVIIVPNCNLVRNLGFGADSTNTYNPNAIGHDLLSEEMEFPLRHTEFVMVDRIRDNLYFRKVNSTMMSRFKSNLKRILPKPVIDKIFKPLMSLLSQG
ncbi:hemolytic protein HlpA [soil metagenome]